jgi:hypothetical protein
MKIWTIRCAVLLTVCSPNMALCKQIDAERSIAVEAIGVEKSGQDFYLDMRVWNCSSKQLTMDIADLPWGLFPVSQQVIYHPASGKVMQAQIPIEDFPDTPYVIAAGGYVSGRVDLGRHFPDLAKIRHPDNWVVFWLYEPFGSKNIPIGKFGGMIPLDQTPSSSPGKSACRMGARG